MSGPDSGNASTEQTQVSTNVGSSGSGGAATGNIGNGSVVTSTSTGGGAILKTNVDHSTITTNSLDTQFAKDVLAGLTQFVAAQSNSNVQNQEMNTAAINSAYTSALGQVANLAQGTQTDGLSVILKPALYIGGAIAALLILVLLTRKN